jgi:hypothetical protein
LLKRFLTLSRSRNPSVIPSKALASISTSSFDFTPAVALTLKFRCATRPAISTNRSIAHLYPGTHELVMTSIDKFDRRGRPGDSIKIVVPNISSITAPAAKVIKIR